MGVAPQNDRLPVALAQAQNLEVVGHRLLFVAVGIERTVVDLEQHAVLLGSQHQRLEIQLGRAVARMADDVDMRVTDSPQHGGRILVDVARPVTERMQPGYAQVEKPEILLFQIEPPCIIDNIDFGTQQQLHAIHPARHYRQVAEIDVGAGAGDTPRVFGNTQYLQTLVGRGLYHLLQGAEGMPAGYRVRMYIEKNIHNKSSLIVLQRYEKAINPQPHLPENL